MNEGPVHLLEPHIHHNTQNLSAIKIWHILKSLSVKNSKFMLTLYDEDLKYIDPFDKHLSVEMQRRVHAEIVRNYWYYLREIVRINAPGGVTPFVFNRGNLALSWLMTNNINCYVEIPRQTTKTGTVAAFMGYVWAFGGVNLNTSFFANTPVIVKDNLERVKDVLKNLPWYLQMMDEKKDSINKESLKSESTNNRIIVRNPPATEQQAMNKSRGATEPEQWFDELPHIPSCKTIFLNSAPAWSKAKDFAKMNGAPYCRICTSTPGVLGTEEGDFIFYDMLPQCIGFDEKLFYDQPDMDSLRTLIDTQSKNNFVYIRFSYKQLGFGEDYFRDICKVMQNNLETITREVLLMWSRRSNDSPFTKEQLERVYRYVTPPIGTITIRNTYVLKIFKKPDVKKKYVISVDCSGMLENDYSSLVIIDPQTFELIGTLRSNARTAYSNTTIFTYCIIDVATMFVNALIAIEKNNMGVAIIDNIMTLKPELITRLYASALEPDTKTTNETFYLSTADNINLTNKTRAVAYGFDTTTPRRAQMFSELLGIIINELYDVLHDNDIFLELNNIVRNKKGKLEHKFGKHDDILLAYLIGLWVLCYSKILADRYDYPIGYIRPMSLADDAKRIEESDLLEKSMSTLEDVIKIQTTAFLGKNNYNSIIDMKPTLSVDTRNSLTHESEFDKGNNSYADIAEMVFGSEESLLDLTETEVIEELEMDDVLAEDIQQTMTGMSISEREQYKRQKSEELDRKIVTAKMAKKNNIEKARYIREQNILRERMRQGISDNMSDTTLDTIINAFLDNK